MGISSALRSAAKGAPDVIKASLKRSKSLFKKAKSLVSRVDAGTQQGLQKALKGDPEIVAKSFDDAGDGIKNIEADEVVTHPLGKGPGETPKTSVKGEAPPAKDPTTNMPDGPPKVTSRWAQVSPYFKGVGVSGILAGVGVGTWLAVAGVYLQNTDGVEVKITKIEKVKDQQKQYKFTYATQGGQSCGPSGAEVPCIQDAFTPCKDDTFTFRNTYTNPNLNDVTALVIDVDDSAVYFELDLTDIGTGTPEWGFMTCHTSFKNQFRSSVRDAVSLVADLAADVGSPLLGGLCDAVPIPFICPDAFNFGNWVLWLTVICCLLCCLALVFMLLQ